MVTLHYCLGSRRLCLPVEHYSRGGNSGNPYMYHLYIHMSGPLMFTKISFTSCLYLTFIAFIRKEKLLCLSSSSIISLTSLFQSILSHISPYCPSRQLLPLYPWPRVPDSTHMTWRPWGAWPPCHRTNRGLKTKDLGPFGRRNGLHWNSNNIGCERWIFKISKVLTPWYIWHDM